MTLDKISTLRPGLLVSLKTRIVGNVKYKTVDIEADHVTDTGERKARWETERTVFDPVEHELAVKTRSKVRGLITGVCASSEFGLLCPEDNVWKLNDAVVEARKIADAFNSDSKLSRIQVFIITGRIAPDDAEAIRAISSEVVGLLKDMETGIANLDASAVREAANKARNVGSMLSASAAERIKTAIDAARTTARRIKQAGEAVTQEIDLQTIRLITEARLSFLDMDEPAGEVAAPVEDGRAVEYAPEEEEFAVDIPTDEGEDENPAPRSADVGRAIEFD